MAGLNFQTQTIINSNLDPDSGKKVVLFEGKGTPAFCLKIKRDFTFVKNNIVKIYKKLGEAPVLSTATVDFTTLASKLAPKSGKNYCRLDIYLGVEGAEPFIYSTPWVQKGMPFWVEFAVDSSESAGGTAIAERVKKAIMDNHIFLCDKDLIKVEASEGTLTLTCANEFQRFKSIKVSMCPPNEIYETTVATEKDTEITINNGKNGFGTYSQIIKDLRLPTAANYQWSHIRQVETPILDAIYDEFIIEYKAPAVNDGLHCVGQRMESTTTHVFWVKNDVTSAFDSALSTAGFSVETVPPLSAAAAISEAKAAKASELNK